MPGLEPGAYTALVPKLEAAAPGANAQAPASLLAAGGEVVVPANFHFVVAGAGAMGSMIAARLAHQKEIGITSHILSSRCSRVDSGTASVLFLAVPHVCNIFRRSWSGRCGIAESAPSKRIADPDPASGSPQVCRQAAP